MLPPQYCFNTSKSLIRKMKKPGDVPGPDLLYNACSGITIACCGFCFFLPLGIRQRFIDDPFKLAVHTAKFIRSPLLEHLESILFYT